MSFLSNLFSATPLGTLWDAYDGSSFQNAVEDGPIGIDSLAFRETFRDQERLSRDLGNDFMGDNFSWWKDDANENVDNPEKAAAKTAATMALLYGGWGLSGYGSAGAAQAGSSMASSAVTNAASTALQGGNSTEIAQSGLRGAVGGSVGGIAGQAAGSLGAGSSLANAAGNTTNSYLSSLMSGASSEDALRNAGTSFLGSYMPDVGGSVGIENPSLRRAFNGGLRNMLMAQINDGDVGRAGISGALPDLVSYGLSSFSNPNPVNGESSGTQKDITNMNHTPSESYTTSNFQFPELNQFFQKLMPSTPQQWGSLAEGLLGMYSGYRQRRDARSLRQGMGANREAYRTELARKLARRDAASGRRSNYAGRDTQLQAALAELDARNMPGMLGLQNQEFAGLANLFQSGLRTAGKLGAFGPEYTPGYQQASQVPSSSYLLSTQPQAPINYGDFSGTRFGDSYLARRNLLGGG